MICWPFLIKITIFIWAFFQAPDHHFTEIWNFALQRFVAFSIAFFLIERLKRLVRVVRQSVVLELKYEKKVSIQGQSNGLWQCFMQKTFAFLLLFSDLLVFLPGMFLCLKEISLFLLDQKKSLFLWNGLLETNIESNLFLHSKYFQFVLNLIFWKFIFLSCWIIKKSDEFVDKMSESFHLPLLARYNNGNLPSVLYFKILLGLIETNSWYMVA
jgi:hypothetical protein